MNSLSINLNEKEEIINELTKEKNKLENTIIEISNIIKLKDKYIIELEKLLDNNKIKHKEYSKLDNNKIDLNKLISLFLYLTISFNSFIFSSEVNKGIALLI